MSKDEHDAMRLMLRDFTRREVIPGAAQRDETGEMPSGILRRLGELGAMGITVPAEHGGLGLPAAVLVAAVEEIACGDAALASIYTAHYLAVEALALASGGGRTYDCLAPLARGDWLGAFALTEPDAGSDIASMATVAKRDGDGFVIDGSKTFISNAAEAGLTVVFAKTAREANLSAISAFAVPAGTTGVTYSAPQDKCGLRSAPTYTIYLDGARLPADAMIGEAGSGGRLALEVLNRGRIDIAAMANGIAMRALQLSVEHATERRQFGQRLRDFQAVQLLLGEMDAALQVGRLAVRWAASERDSGGSLRRAASLAKYVATENCFSVVDKALQVHGGMGYMRETEIERLYRDCRVLRIYEGTSQIQLLGLARQLAVRFDSEGVTS
ncbi:MAG: acyl-CoA dehydrogenase family protein [Acidimicrobiales bacterium]